MVPALYPTQRALASAPVHLNHRAKALKLKHIHACVVLLSLFGARDTWAQSEQSVDYAVVDGALVSRQSGVVTDRLAIPCADAPGQLWELDGRLFISCDRRVIELDTSTPSKPVVARALEARAPVVSLKLIAGELVVATRAPRAALEAAPLSSLDEAIDEPDGPDEARGDSQEEEAKVFLGEDGVILFGLGRQSGIELGEIIELPGPQDRPVLSGRVVAVRGDSSELSTPLNYVVAPGAMAKRTGRVSPEPLPIDQQPLHPVGVPDLIVEARPVLLSNSTRGGSVLDAQLTLRGPRHFAFVINAGPWAFLRDEDSSIRSGYATALAGYDGEVFGLGGGLGLLHLNDPRTVDRPIDDPLSSPQSTPNTRRTSLTFSQSLRFGHLDGAHIQVFNHLNFSDDALNIGGFFTRGQLRLRERSWFTARVGGGGDSETFVAELGARQHVLGSGMGGSIFLRLNMGVVMVSDVVGLTAGCGVEARFGGKP